jgi:malonate-semialdehyde dehydrogenase (acetylating)/methylmalonate-semialdehyde dehydrogenase
MMGDALEQIATGIDCVSVRQPMGVFAVIAPYNFPSMVPLWFLPYAIATGNTMVVKPSEQVPFSQQRLFELDRHSGSRKGS